MLNLFLRGENLKYLDLTPELYDSECKRLGLNDVEVDVVRYKPSSSGYSLVAAVGEGKNSLYIYAKECPNLKELKQALKELHLDFSIRSTPAFLKLKKELDELKKENADLKEKLSWKVWQGY